MSEFTTDDSAPRTGTTTKGKGYKPVGQAEADLAAPKVYDAEGPKMSDFGKEDDIVARAKWNKARSDWLRNKQQKEALGK